jgi:hypothetical protein
MNKKENAQMLDPTRFKISQQNAVVPGGPQNNNPMNVVGVGNQPASPNGISQHPYGDTGNFYPQMGADVLNPMQVGPSKLLSEMGGTYVMGQGLNGGAPFGLQQQPDTSGVSMAPDGMESGRLATEVQQRGVPAGPMGYQGMPAVPGNIQDNPAFNGAPLMQGMPSAEFAAGKGTNMKTGKRGK